MTFNSNSLLSELKETVNKHIYFSKQLLEVSEEILQLRKTEHSWSTLECIEHLNLYARYYNEEIETKMKRATLSPSETFKSGYLGNKFANDMLPKEKLNKMKTFKSKNPIHSTLNKETVILEFIKHQGKLLSLLETAATKNLKVKIQTTLPLLKFKLGDTFRFVINHNIRHIEQAKKALEN